MHTHDNGTRIAAHQYERNIRMRLAQVPERLAQVQERLSNLAEEHQVAERLQHAGHVASDAARRGARLAYHTALEHPRAASAGAVAVAAALVGGVLWVLFRDRRRRHAAHRRPAARVRAGTERRKRRHARAAA
jgi:hypothetical protein